MKAFRQGKDVVIFRTKDHLNRLNNSARILDIPPIDVDLVYDALHQLITIEKDWVPAQRGQAYTYVIYLADIPITCSTLLV